MWKKIPLAVVVCLLAVIACKPIAREEPAAREQQGLVAAFKKASDLFDYFIVKGNHKKARLLFQQQVERGDVKEARSLIEMQMKTGNKARVVAFFNSYVAESTQRIANLVKRIAISETDNDVAKLMKEMHEQIDSVRTAFNKQREAIATVTGNSGDARDARHYLWKNQYGKKWYDFNQWAEDTKYKLWQALTDYTEAYQAPSWAYVPTEKLLSERLMQAWYTVKSNLNPEKTSVPVP